MMFHKIGLILACLGLFASHAEATSVIYAGRMNDWVFLDDGQVRLGVKLSSGAAIGWFSLNHSDRNVINHWDRGRLIQQSYYGRKDGSRWAKKPWCWNPVQGGDWDGNGARVLALTYKTNSLYAKTEPKHWATGANLTNVVMKEWITITGRVAHIRYQMTYKGTHIQPVKPQEIPAIFVNPAFKTLILYAGPRPWTDAPLQRSQPGWPNQSRRITEHWAAYVNKNDFGVGAFVPVANNITCYRFGDGRADHGACSYFAPLAKFAITPGKIFTYNVFLTLGHSKEIRSTFYKIHQTMTP